MTRKQPNSWRAVTRKLNAMSEDEVKAMLVDEMSSLRRVTVVERLHQRFSMLRATRERLELMKELSHEAVPSTDH